MAAPAKTTVHRHKRCVRRGAVSIEDRTQKLGTPFKNGHAQYPSTTSEDAPRLQLSIITPFTFDGQAIRVAAQDGEHWFASADVCGLLEIRNPRSAVARLDDDEKGVANNDTLGGMQALSVVNESGLYHLIFRSRKPQASAFRRWVTTEVLPSIRKTGSYKAVEAEAPDDVRPLQVDLPGPGRYVIMTVPGKAAYVRRTEYDAMFVESDALDRQLMACALTTTAAYWHKVQQLRAVGADQAEGDMLQRFERDPGWLDPGGRLLARAVDAAGGEVGERTWRRLTGSNRALPRPPDPIGSLLPTADATGAQRPRRRHQK